MLDEGVLTCTHNLCFEQLREIYKKNSTGTCNFLQFVYKNLYIVWCVHNFSLFFTLSVASLEVVLNR